LSKLTGLKNFYDMSPRCGYECAAPVELTYGQSYISTASNYRLTTRSSYAVHIPDQKWGDHAVVKDVLLLES